MSQKEILAIFDNLTDGLMVFNKEGKLLLINSMAQRIFFLKEQDTKKILGSSIEQFSDVPFLNNLFFLLGKEIKECFRRELEIKQELILEITSSSVLKNKEKTGTLVILRDVTREKTVERMKTEFVTISAHQLRTPLSAMQWMLERLLQEKAGKLTEEQKMLLQKAFKDNKKMIALISDLLNLVKIEEGKQDYQLKPARIDEVIESAISAFQEEIKNKNIKFEFQIPAKKLPKVKIDSEQVGFVIQNLLDNAIKYTPAGGTVRAAIELKDQEIEVSIQDSGMGIPKKQQKDIFKKFFRAGNAVKIDTEGKGTGLFIAKNIIEAHNGKMWFESAEGKGTTFYFTLPLNR